MRPDFNKLLTERERIGHSRKYHEVRNAKVFVPNEELQAGRESMKRRYSSWTDRKSFNENLNPLRSFIHRSVGKRWDAVYSEICTTFDKRKVINQHILQHLFQYVTIDLKYIDGVLCRMETYRNGGWTPIAGDSFIEWYVDPKDGILKANKIAETQKQRGLRQAKEAAAKRAEVWRKIDDYNFLGKEKGIWFHYVAKDSPPKIKKIHPPQEMVTGDRLMFEKLTEVEKLKAGGKVEWIEPVPKDRIFTSAEVAGQANLRRYSWDKRERGVKLTNRYFCARNTASKAMLKQFGLDGTATIDETETLSHRKRAKHGIKT